MLKRNSRGGVEDRNISGDYERALNKINSLLQEI